MHSLQCTEKLDLQCSEEASKISASIVVIQTIKQGFLTRSDSLKEMSVKEKGGWGEFFQKQTNLP